MREPFALNWQSLMGCECAATQKVSAHDTSRAEAEAAWCLKSKRCSVKSAHVTQMALSIGDQARFVTALPHAIRLFSSNANVAVLRAAEDVPLRFFEEVSSYTTMWLPHAAATRLADASERPNATE